MAVPPRRRALMIPGAWAMGEGVLIELEEAEEGEMEIAPGGSCKCCSSGACAACAAAGGAAAAAAAGGGLASGPGNCTMLPPPPPPAGSISQQWWVGNLTGTVGSYLTHITSALLTPITSCSHQAAAVDAKPVPISCSGGSSSGIPKSHSGPSPGRPCSGGAAGSNLHGACRSRAPELAPHFVTTPPCIAQASKKED